MNVCLWTGAVGLSLGGWVGLALAAGPSLRETFDAPLGPAAWGRIDETYSVADGKLVAFDGGASQTDCYLLTADDHGDFLLEFTLTCTGQASGPQERAQVVYAIAGDDVANRRFIWLDAGGNLPVGQPVRVTVIVRDGEASLLFDGAGTGRRMEVVGAPGRTGRVGFLHYFNYARPPNRGRFPVAEVAETSDRGRLIGSLATSATTRAPGPQRWRWGSRRSRRARPGRGNRPVGAFPDL